MTHDTHASGTDALLSKLMSKLANQWIQIFRAGTYPPQGDGVEDLTFTQADVQQVVDNYDPAQFEAPAVVGHPEHDCPAYAWFGEVKREGDVLLGKPRQVDPTFEAAVEAGRFKNRSARFTKTKNGWTLRHVGFLGAKLPEVKGLAPIQFSTEDAQAIELEFSEETDVTPSEQQTFNERMKTFFEGIFGGKQAASTASFSEADVKRIATEAVTSAVAPLQAKLDAQTATFSEREKTLSTAETQAKVDAAVSRVKAAGAWVPAFEKMGISAVFAELAKAPATVTIEFGEGATRTAKSPLETMVSFMEGLKQIVPAAEIYTGKSAAKPAVGGKINTSTHIGVDSNSVAFAEAINQRIKDKSLSFEVAMRQVAEEQPQLTVPGGASAGQA